MGRGGRESGCLTIGIRSIRTPSLDKKTQSPRGSEEPPPHARSVERQINLAVSRHVTSPGTRRRCGAARQTHIATLIGSANESMGLGC